MRLTVGPLPPAVYWRRRAVVIGAVLLFLIVVLYSCTGQDDPKKPGAQPGTGGGSSAPSAPASAGSSPSGSASPGAAAGSSASPGAGNSSGGTGTGTGGDTGAGSGNGPAVQGPPAAGPVDPTGAAGPPANGCTDAEMSVIPVPTPTTVRRGAVVALQLKIKNASARTCDRDVGADLQEIYIKLGAQKIWSSDTCGTARGSDIVRFPPGHERTYQVDWNGRDSSRCAEGLATGPFPAAGEYQVTGRLGGKLSEPVTLTVVN